LIGGRRKRSEENNSAASARPSKICDAAIENKMEISDPQIR